MDCAYREITFALTILESLCEDNMLDEKMTSRAKDLARRLRPDSQLPKVLHQREDDTSLVACHRIISPSAFGSKEPSAGILLPQASESVEADALLLGDVLFGLALQQGQGNEQAIDS